MALIGTVACDNAQSAPELDHDLLDVRTLTGEVLSEAPILGRPYGVVLSGDILWVREGAGEPYLHAVDLRSGEIVESVGRNGAGPGEFDGTPFVLSASKRDPGSVWAFDLSLRRFTLVQPGHAPDAESRVVLLDGTPRVMKAVSMPDNEFVGVTASSEARFVRFDSTGARVTQRPGPLLGDASVPEAERRKATITGFAICPHPAGGFAVVYGTAGRVELYDSSASLVDTALVPFPSQPAFARDERTGRTRWVDDRSWYLDCEATSRHLYALFAGRSTTEFRGGQAAIGRFLHVFSWDDGELVSTFELDPPIGSIAINPAGTTLYGASVATAKIYRFRLPTTP
jgi:hypothetical protein